MINKVFIQGNLTRDPELKFLPSGTGVASFGLACNRPYKSGEEWKEDVCFVDLKMWGAAAEKAADKHSKGDGVMVEGRLTYESWESKDGGTRSRVLITAERMVKVEKGERKKDKSNEDEDIPF